MTIRSIQPPVRASAMVGDQKDDAKIEWVHRSDRYHEKLATPDVTIADLIGEVDLVKHAEGRYLSDESTMHFGMIPRSNRGIFAINELPDLAPRIQVGLFNVLEERDVQIRGYPIRLDLDVCLVFSANPEDYTNRGRIVTPLKDRIGSVIRTHYPETVDEGIKIAEQNAWVKRSDGDSASGVAVDVPRFMSEIIEETVRLARSSPHVSQASGVSVRTSIANLETLISNAERRGILTGEKRVVPRICDLNFLIACCRGKIEMTLAEEEGAEDKLIRSLVGEAVKAIFAAYDDADSSRKDYRAIQRQPDLPRRRRSAGRGIRREHESHQGPAPAATGSCQRNGLDAGDPAVARLCRRVSAGRVVREQSVEQVQFRRGRRFSRSKMWAIGGYRLLLSGTENTRSNRALVHAGNERQRGPGFFTSPAKSGASLSLVPGVNQRGQS